MATSFEPTPASDALTYRSERVLAALRTGQSKERVFEAFATAFVERGGKIVEVQGMRLRTSGRSGTGARIEIGEVLLTGRDDRGAAYWFLFENARLLAWGRPEQWDATAKTHGLDVPYHPGAAPRPSEARVDLGSGR